MMEPVSEDTAGGDETVDGVAHGTNKDPELVAPVYIFLNQKF